MNKWTRYWLLMPVLLVQALSSCSLIDEPEDNGDPVMASLAFTVSSAAGTSTRMADAVVQEQGNGRSYRGLGQVYMIPFAISGNQITSSDHPSRLLQDASLKQGYNPDPLTGNYGGFYLYNVYTLVRGINAFLVYGKAGTSTLSVPSDDIASKAYLGSLQIPELVYPDLVTLRFSPDPIYSGTSAPDGATLLAGYLNHIAQADGWSTTTDETLKLLYKLFTGQENDGTMVLAGASVNVMAHVNALYDLLSPLSFTGNQATIKAAILTSIGDYTATGLSLTLNDGKLTDIKVKDGDYPSSLGLPDGAAALRWAKLPNSEDYGFVPQTETTTLDNINNINRFCFPPELFYYANSRIDTSNDEVNSYTSATEWTTLLENYYENKNAMVTGNTQAIAIQQPLHYAVGRLKVTLQKVNATTLKDDAGKEIPLTYEEESVTKPSFPLTGIIICNQHPVGFDFKPVLSSGAASHVDDHFIYDSQVGTSCCLSATEDNPILSTLVLQSYDAEEVTIALEFRNDSGVEFRGKGGVIYPGTKFYLMGKIDPTTGTTDSTTGQNAEGRVFTQDYITTVSTKVESLANAYNVLPNMLGGRLELGVELTPNWIQAKTTNVILE